VIFNQDVSQNGDFFSDELRVKMILNNLVSNAIKYRDENKAEQRFNLTISSDHANAKIEIEDNGKGIPRENLSKIFEMFFRSAEAGVGSGIGLYIVNEAVVKLGGEIDVASEPGHFTKFTITIPNKS
jgi:signal transduction histidine kinase